jgi:hypothetical protein
MGNVKILCGIIALGILALLSPPARGQEAVLAFICTDRAQAEVLAGEMTDHSPPLVDVRWSSCEPIGKPVGSMEGAPPPSMGPLKDWEGDPFALYTDGVVVFIMFWVNGYLPTTEAGK